MPSMGRALHYQKFAQSSCGRFPWSPKAKWAALATTPSGPVGQAPEAHTCPGINPMPAPIAVLEQGKLNWRPSPARG